MTSIIKIIFLAILSLSLLNSCDQSKEKQLQELPGIVHPDTLQFEITEANNIIFKTAVIDSDTLDLFLDTGGTEIVLKHSAVKEKTSFLKNGKNSSYKEENYEPLEGLYSLKLGKLKWDSLTIYPTSLLPKEADGHFGWNLFQDKVVELDYEKNLMIVHNSFSQDLSDYAQLEIEYINTLICIKGNIKNQGAEYLNRYLFDSGFQRAVILDKDLRQEAKFPDNLPVVKESRLKNSAGTEFVNRVVMVDKICFEEICAQQVPVQLLSTPNPARFETHILGNELLKRFNTILDLQNDYIYMKPNSLISLPYKDAS